MTDCIFCKIIAGEIPSNKVYEDDDMLCFYDVDPQAPIHVLIVPKMHVCSLNECDAAAFARAGKIVAKVPHIASLLGIADEGYRLVVNTGKNGGQTVSHLHFHLLGGRYLEWPPG